MFARYRIAFVGLLGAAVVAALSLGPAALARDLAAVGAVEAAAVDLVE